MTPSIDIHRGLVTVERIWHEGGPRLGEPVRRGWSAVVVTNPFAGRFVDELVPYMDALEPLAHDMTAELLEALRAKPSEIQSYGKGAIVGIAGELEHAAMWHAPGGAGLRRALGGGAAGVPGAMKLGAVGTTLDVALGNMDAANVRSHYDSISVTIGGSPRPAELILVVAVATGGRPHARIGSLISAEEARRKAARP